jgi:hypothetical protein
MLQMKHTDPNYLTFNLSLHARSLYTRCNIFIGFVVHSWAYHNWTCRVYQHKTIYFPITGYLGLFLTSSRNFLLFWNQAVHHIYQEQLHFRFYPESSQSGSHPQNLIFFLILSSHLYVLVNPIVSFQTILWIFFCIFVRLFSCNRLRFNHSNIGRRRIQIIKILYPVFTIPILTPFLFFQRKFHRSSSSSSSSYIRLRSQ